MLKPKANYLRLDIVSCFTLLCTIHQYGGQLPEESRKPQVLLDGGKRMPTTIFYSPEDCTHLAVVAQACVPSRTDKCNSSALGHSLRKLKRLQNAAAHLLSNTGH